MYPAAAKDLEKAVENAGSDEIFLITGLDSLGTVYHAMKDDQKALDSYRKVTSRGKDQFYIHYSSVLACAKILVQQAKYDEAVAELKKADISKTTGNWKYLFLEAYGDIDIAQGRKEEGIAKYKEAMATKDVAGIYIDMMNKKIDSLNDK